METILEKLKRVWPEWEIIEKIGEGAFGEVFRAVRNDLAGTTYAAIKAICIPKDEDEIEELKAEGLTLDQSYTYLKQVVKDYTHEIKLMDSVKGYTNIVSIDDYRIVESDDQMMWYIFIRMELLTPLVKKATLVEFTEEDIIRAGIDLCTALDVCRKKNIVHRDIKPQNIFVNDDGDYKLGDFGVARSLNRTATNLSRKGAPNYMAPELYKASLREISIDDAAKVDIYSLGLVLYWMGNRSRLPFLPQDKQITTPEDRENAFMKRVSGDAFPDPAKVSPELSRIILKACAYKPEDRYASAEEMKNELIKLRDGERAGEVPPGGQKTGNGDTAPQKKHKLWWLIPVAAAVLIAAGIGAGVIARPPEPTPVPAVTAPAEETPASEEESEESTETDRDDTASASEGVSGMEDSLHSQVLSSGAEIHGEEAGSSVPAETAQTGDATDQSAGEEPSAAPDEEPAEETAGNTADVQESEPEATEKPVITEGEMINRYGKTNTGMVAFRQAPDATKDNIITRLDKDATVYLLRADPNEAGESWTCVIWKDTRGYVETQYLDMLTQKDSDEWNNAQNSPAPVYTKEDLPPMTVPETTTPDSSDSTTLTTMTPTPAPSPTPTPTSATVPVLSVKYSGKNAKLHEYSAANSGEKITAYTGPGTKYESVKLNPNSQKKVTAYFAEKDWVFAYVIHSAGALYIYVPKARFDELGSIKDIKALDSLSGKTTKTVTPRWGPNSEFASEKDYAVSKGTAVKVFFTEGKYSYCEYKCGTKLVRMWLPSSAVQITE